MPDVRPATPETALRADELAALRLSESRLKLAATALRGYIYDWDQSTGTVWRSGAFEEMTGFGTGELGDGVEFWHSRVHPDDQHVIAAARHAAVERQQDRFSVEYRVRRRDGRYLWVWDHSVAVRDAAGRVTRVVGNVLDIGARKLAEEQLRASEHRFKAAVSATADLLWAADQTGAMQATQETWSTLLGEPSEAWIHDGWLAAAHPEEREETRRAWQHAVENGVAFVSETRIRRHDDVYRTFAIRATPVKDESGTVTEWIGVHRDVTEQRDLEVSLRDTSQRLQLALRAAQTGMWSWDYKLRVMQWDSECAAISGLPATALNRSPDALLERVRADHRERLLRLIAVPRLAPSDATAEFEFERPDGRARWALVQALIVEDAHGQALRAIGTLRDITDRKAYQAQQENLLDAERAARSQMESAAKAKDDFLATVSHELRTPLNAMLGWTHLLQRPGVTPAVLADGLRIIERNGRAQARLIESLFDANRLMSGKFDFELVPLEPDAIVQLAIDSAAPEFARKRQQPASNLRAGDAMVLGDARRLQQVVTNLLSNASKHSPEGAVIEIATEITPEAWRLRVTDFGEGIDAQILPHVFERFFQAESGSARRHGGLGLGLAISRQIVEHLGGRIEARSDGVGRGATFEVRVPLSVFAPAARAQTDADAAPMLALPNDALRGVRILAVDDEPDALEYVSRVLREQGAVVIAADSCAQALQRLDTADAPFDALVSDIGLPGRSGYELIRMIRQRAAGNQRGLPAIALTAFARQEDRQAALEAGFQRHLAKPFHVSDLVRAVADLSRRRSTDGR